MGSVPGLGRSPEEGNGSPLQYSCLENPMDRGALQATVHGGHESWTQLVTKQQTNKQKDYSVGQTLEGFNFLSALW